MIVQAMAVDRIDAEDHRNAQTRLLHRRLLNLSRVVAQYMQKRARAQLCPAQGLLAPDKRIGHLHHLRSLLLQRHAGKKLLHARRYLLMIHTSSPYFLFAFRFRLPSMMIPQNDFL